MPAYTDITGLGRELDPRLASNRIAIAGGAVAFLVLATVGLVRGGFDVFEVGFGAVSVFLAWAVSRELDPDRPDAATWAMALALGGTFLGSPSALAAGVALIAIRLVAGTVGTSLKRLDLIVLAGVTALAGASPVLWVFGAALGIWAWTAPEAEENRTPVRVAFVLGAAAGLAFAAWTTWFGDGYDVEITMAAYALAAVAGAAMLLSVRHMPIESMCDSGDQPISAERVRLARIVSGAGVMWAAVFGGVAGFWALGPVVAALVVAAVYRVFVHAA